MGRITLQQAAAWCGGQIDPKYADVAFFGASNDTRTIQPGQLFLALKGARDGHDFIPQALEKGASAVLCTHCDGDYPAIVVEDTRIALGLIAREERKRLGMKVVGITGSVGKSTTKEMIATVLESTYRTGKTPVNHNNDIGMPMAILALPEDTQVAVLEMGMNHFREIAYLTNIAKPDVAVIINIGTMHIEHLGSIEGILRAKLEILEGMGPDSTLILNGDDQLLWNAQKRSQIHNVFFGVENGDAEILGSDIKLEVGSVSFDVAAGDRKFRVELPLEGVHFVSDALAAVTVGMALDVAPEKIQESLLNFRNMEGRQEVIKAQGYTIIKDCYNAGPESMAASLNVLGSQKADFLLSYGPNSSRMLKGAITGGMIDGRAKAFEDRMELVQTLKRLAKPGDVILFKGSRGMHMEIALEQFLMEEN